MGPGRRMKKQAPPEPLPEWHFAKLRQAAGLPAQPAPAQPSTQNKKRKAAELKTSGNAKKKPKTTAARVKLAATTVAAAIPNGPATNGKAANAQAAAGRANAKSRNRTPARPPPSGSGSDDDLLAGSEVLSDLEDGPGLRDDFLGSDSDVYDSGDEQETRAMFSEDDSDSDGEEKLTAANIEGLSRKLDQQRAEDDAADAAELQGTGLQTNLEGDGPDVLPDGDDELAAKPKSLLTPDLQVLRSRITETIRVLEDFTKLAQKGRSRSEHMAQLVRDICLYYGYSEYLGQKLFDLFPPREAFQFFEANETARPLVIRTNTLRTTRRDLGQALINRGVTLEPVPGKWSKVGLQIFESNVSLGATPEYLAGHYLLQSASSFLPVVALDPQEGERVLDMAAAPGGKTTYISAMMKNTGIVVSNDPSRQRTKALVGNIHRLGCRNTMVTNYDARIFPKPMGGFDRVLLDAPCSGTGVISKDPSVKTSKTEMDFIRLPHTQKQLLLAAIDSVKEGGVVVYSTCSVTVDENEAVVNYVLQKRPQVKIVDSGLPFGKEGFKGHLGKHFHPSLGLARRYYAHTYNMDGFFLAKLVKTGSKTAGSAEGPRLQDELDEAADKAPIVDPESQPEGTDDFGGFDSSEDDKYIDRGRKSAMRRRGVNPKGTRARKGEPGSK